ncbi:class E sortase [Streptomyces sp. NPDC048650]|uniref:class E sortase n=1 Tax=Streptomyces sp. NPDC048650 TaxID=3365583 RepID=UPI003721A23E
MTALRPEREERPYEPYDPAQPYASEQPDGPQDPYGPSEPYGHPDAFEAAVGQLDDPLNDPLPGQATPAPEPGAYERPERPARHAANDTAGRHAASDGSPWFRPQREDEHPGPPVPLPGPRPGSYGAASHWPRNFGPEPTAHGHAPGHGDGTGHGTGQESGTAAEPMRKPYAAPRPPAPAPVPPPLAGTQTDDETMALRQAEEPGAGRDGAVVSRETTGSGDVSRETDAPPASGGRAARRKAAQEAAKRGGRRARHGGAGSAAAKATSAATSAATSVAAEPPPAPTSRLEARRAARAAKESLSLIVSRAVGEVFISLGVLMLLFVTYQLWWTNVMAGEEAGGATTTLQHEWQKGGGEKKNLAAGERFGIMYIPKLDVKAPIAEGIDKHNVLDHGMVGHYDKSSGIKTAMPWDKKGNFSVAAHRNTHGEPFRYINKLTKGDKIVVETQSAYYTYEMESILPQTSPSNTSVIGPVPPGSGFTGPGRYITLTTCTPEFTSTYRMIVWGKMVDERPRSKGEPKALTG